ncbi:MAG TPA: pyruvate kinase [Gemmataceae bacterium]|nr:pyruvate kinase [Gemmataceae bacterium]
MSNHPPHTTVFHRRRTKIVATVGPASRDPAMLDALIHAGVNVFRLNMSHGDHDGHRTNFERIRAAASAVGEPVAILADLCGPKIRVGRLAGGRLTLETGQRVTVTTRNVLGEPGLIPSQYPALAQDVRPGDHILLDDGMLELRVVSVAGTEILCDITAGGVLKDRKGMNLPGVMVSSPSLTDKDRDDAHFALDLGVDYLALSFVRRPRDVIDLKELIASTGANTPVIAKIEKPEALDAIDEILEASDGLMVARGDLGVELAPEAVPIVQHDLVQRARLRNKPIIVATQMLESMIEHPRPTRAEVSDVSHAVFAGADAVMLSAETASGAFPVKAVEMMDRVARQVEGWQWIEGGFRSITEGERELPRPLSLRLAVARSTAQLSRDLRVRAVVVRTLSGPSALVIAATRPSAPIIALTRDERVYRRMNLLWGVIPQMIDASEFDRPQAVARRRACELDLAEEGQTILLLAGFGKGEPMITVLQI